MIAINKEMRIYDPYSSHNLMVDKPYYSCIEAFEKLSIHDKIDEIPIPYLERVHSDLNYTQIKFGTHHRKSAEAWNALGLARVHMQGDTKEALRCHEHALDIFRYLNMALETAMTLNDVAFCCERLGQHEVALKKYVEALKIFVEEDLKEDHLQVIATRRAISRITRT